MHDACMKAAEPGQTYEAREGPDTPHSTKADTSDGMTLAGHLSLF